MVLSGSGISPMFWTSRARAALLAAYCLTLRLGMSSARTVCRFFLLFAMAADGSSMSEIALDVGQFKLEHRRKVNLACGYMVEQSVEHV